MDNNTRVLFASAMKQFVRGGEYKVDIFVREGVYVVSSSLVCMGKDKAIRRNRTRRSPSTSFQTAAT